MEIRKIFQLISPGRVRKDMKFELVLNESKFRKLGGNKCFIMRTSYWSRCGEYNDAFVPSGSWRAHCYYIFKWSVKEGQTDIPRRAQTDITGRQFPKITHVSLDYANIIRLYRCLGKQFSPATLSRSVYSLTLNRDQEVKQLWVMIVQKEKYKRTKPSLQIRQILFWNHPLNRGLNRERS